MDKELRTSSNPQIVVESGIEILEFTNQFDQTVRYSQSGSNLRKSINGEEIIYGQTGSFSFDQVSFNVTEADEFTPPKVTVSIRGLVTASGSRNETITLQSTTIPRNR